jgi:hypothetical protein
MAGTAIDVTGTYSDLSLVGGAIYLGEDFVVTVFF